jgi:hypothetical protein
VHPGKLEAVKASFPQFVEKTATEGKVLFYEFTVNGDEIFCREGYTDAEGVLAHLDNVSVLLAELLTMADLTPVEVHGPATELEKLKKPLAHLNPAWFVVSSNGQWFLVIRQRTDAGLQALNDPVEGRAPASPSGVIASQPASRELRPPSTGS